MTRMQPLPLNQHFKAPHCSTLRIQHKLHKRRDHQRIVHALKAMHQNTTVPIVQLVSDAHGHMQTLSHIGIPIWAFEFAQPPVYARRSWIQMYIMAISNRKKQIIITITISNNVMLLIEWLYANAHVHDISFLGFYFFSFFF